MLTFMELYVFPNGKWRLINYRNIFIDSKTTFFFNTFVTSLKLCFYCGWLLKIAISEELCVHTWSQLFIMFHFHWAMYIVGISQVEFNCHLKCLKKVSSVILAFVEMRYCVHRKPMNRAMECAFDISEAFIFRECQHIFHIFVQWNNQVLYGNWERKIPTNRWSYVIFCY